MFDVFILTDDMLYALINHGNQQPPPFKAHLTHSVLVMPLPHNSLAFFRFIFARENFVAQQIGKIRIYMQTILLFWSCYIKGVALRGLTSDTTRYYLTVCKEFYPHTLTV